MNDTSVSNRRLLLASGVAFSLFCAASPRVWGQAPPPASTTATAAARQRGTVQAISGSTLTLTTDDKQQVSVTVTPAAKIVQLPPGSTDLKTAQPITLADVSVGDRILVIGAAGADAGTFTAGRVILMKGTDIAAQHEREAADWQRRGTGGIVASVDPAGGAISMTVRGRTETVKISPTTIVRRYAADSVKFEDAQRGTLDQIRPGDQLRVRGARSADGASIDAEEIVSGTFDNLSGTLTAVDANAGTVTLKDLATKRTMTVSLTANSAIHTIPPEMAATLASRGAAGSGGAASGAGSRPPASGAPGQTSRPDAASGSPQTPGSQPREGGRRQGGDLSQMVSRLPAVPITNLHPGDAVLIVASPSAPGSASVTAITLVSGVQSLLTAAQGSAPAVTLSPWTLGGAPAEGGGQ